MLNGNIVIFALKILTTRIKKKILYSKKKKYKAISMMRGKSPPSALLEIIKSNNSLRFLKEFGKGDNYYFCQNIIDIHFNKKSKTHHKKDKTPHKKSLYFTNIKICHFYTLM